MNVIVVPDSAMIVIPLIEKNGHEYLSPTNFSRYNNNNICEGNLIFENLITRYSSSELPSGVKSRLVLFSRIFPDADAAIVIEPRPPKREKMYNALNDLILFGGVSCVNAHNLILKIIKDSKIPTLYLTYPKNQKCLIELIDKTNGFLKKL